MVALTDLPRAHEPETVLHCADHPYKNIFVPQLGLFQSATQARNINCSAGSCVMCSRTGHGSALCRPPVGTVVLCTSSEGYMAFGLFAVAAKQPAGFSLSVAFLS